MKSKFNSIVLLSIIMLIGGYFYVIRNTHTFRSLTLNNVPTPTTFPLRELTILALRERKYKSTLEEKKVIQENGQYTSYLTWYYSDSFKVNGLLTVPTGIMPKGGWPAIVFVHGYIPPKQYVTIEKYVAYVDYLARSGFIVFKIDLRGNGNSEGESRGAYYSTDYVVDTLNAYAALESSSLVNPKKIGLWGHSMAGNVVMRSFAVKPTIPAAIIWAGVGYSYEDIQKYRINDNSYQRPPGVSPASQSRQRLGGIYGEPNLNHFFWQQLAPVSYLKDMKGAIQIHHAVDDCVVNVGYSRDLVKLLDKTTIKHEYYEYANGGHNIEGYSFNQAIQRTVEFYIVNL